jgi:hypothetical protein
MAVETFVVGANGKVSIIKDPNAILDYSFDWTEWLAAASTPPDTIANAQFQLLGTSNATIVSQAFNAQKATAFVSGGLVGENIGLRCRITTAAGRVDDRTVYLKIKER